MGTIVAQQDERTQFGCVVDTAEGKARVGARLRQFLQYLATTQRDTEARSRMAAHLRAVRARLVTVYGQDDPFEGV